MPQLVRRLAALMVAFTLALPLSAAAFPDLAPSLEKLER